MTDDNPPYDATVENIEKICRELRDVSNETAEDLEEKIEDLQGSTFARNLEASVKLGLFEEDEGYYQPTREGKIIGYGLDEDDKKELFRELVQKNEFYDELLQIVGDSLEEAGGEQYLPRDDVQREIGINFDFGVGDRTIESAANTFLKVLEAAGVGTYKQGRSGYPTRLVVNEEYSGFLSNSVGEDSQEKEEDLEESSQSKLTVRDGGEVEENESSSNEELEEEVTPRENQKEMTLTQEIDGEIDVKINIEISSSDWESDDVISLVKSLQND